VAASPALRSINSAILLSKGLRGDDAHHLPAGGQGVAGLFRYPAVGPTARGDLAGLATDINHAVTCSL
jgi:hypothetical protein